jgi:hypothetical protein
MHDFKEHTYIHFLEPHFILILKNILMRVCIKGMSIYNFFIFFYLHFAKIYGPPETLQNYTSAAVVHGVRDITS